MLKCSRGVEELATRRLRSTYFGPTVPTLVWQLAQVARAGACRRRKYNANARSSQSSFGFP